MEVISRQTPPGPDTEGEQVMTEARTSVTEDQEVEPLLANKEGGRESSELPPKMAPETTEPPISTTLPSQEGGATVPPPVPPVTGQATTGWPAMMKEALRSSSIAEDHRILMGAVLQGIQSVDSGLKEAFGGLLTGFKASSSAAAIHDVELAELNQKLKSSDEELGRLNKRFDEMQTITSEVENLKADLEKAKREAANHRMAAEQAAAELSSLKAVSDKDEDRVAEVQQELQDASTKCEAPEQKTKDQVAELSTLSSELKSERVDRRFFEEELRQVKMIADGAFTDLPRSAADVAKHFAARDGDAEQRLFWAQFQTPEPRPLLSYQMKQLMELHRVAEPALKDLCIRLWPSEPLPRSYFGLVQKLCDASSRIEVLKRSVCVEGAQMAFARIMMH